MKVRVDPTDPTPPYEQLRVQLSDVIATGVLVPGQRLPPLRQLASDLGLAVGTVARAYRELESAGLVVSRRGGGTHVADTPAMMSRANQLQELQAHARAYAHRAQLLGVGQAEAQAALAQAFTETHPN